MARICLLTPGQPSSNPRLVKEADALSKAGHEVHVICAHWAHWAGEMDKVLLASRDWTCTYVGGHPTKRPLNYGWTRLRHGLSRRVLAMWRTKYSILEQWAFCRVLPELLQAAEKLQANLYIAHYPEALPAAIRASQKFGAKVGFDIEDFYTNSLKRGCSKSLQDSMTERVESMFLKQCSFTTASSPQIAEAYVAKYGIPRPTSVLNVFPLAQRPREFSVCKTGDPLTLYWFSQTIGPNRGLEDIVQAMGHLRGCRIELHLRGSWAPGYQEQLLSLAASERLSPKQIISHAPEPPDEMVRLATQYHVGLALEQHVSDTREMCLTNKIFTYLLGGNAIIATATKGQRPIVEAIGNAGFCYEPGDVNPLVCRLRLWYEDRMSLEKARRQAWDWGTRRYNWDLEKEKFLQIVETALGVV